MQSLCQHVARLATCQPAAIAVVDEARRISYSEFWSRAQDFSSHLAASGIQAGDRVAIILPNRIESAVAVYGTWLAGGVAVPLNAQARSRDFVNWLRHCGASHLVHEQGHRDVDQTRQEIDVEFSSTVLEPQQPLCATRADEQTGDVSSCDAQSLALIIYTSGTTGAPKGVMLNHANLLANAQAVSHYLQLSPLDKVLTGLPFYYAYGASVLHTQLISGGCVLLSPGLLFPRLVVDMLMQEQATGLSAVPSTYALLLEHGALDESTTASLRYMTQAGGAMSGALARRLRCRIPNAQLFVMYGQTEATSRISWLPPQSLDTKPGSVGIPVSGTQLKIVDGNGHDCAAAETGEVCVQGPGVMQGYWENGESTAAVLRDGWLHTGDMGYLDQEGYLFLHGRRSDMIKTGAHRVHPSDVEEVIAEMQGVTEVAAVGVPDEIMGQVVKAFVIRSDASPTEEKIRAHCRMLMAAYKVPRHVAFVDELPRTASGKIQRNLLGQYEDLP